MALLFEVPICFILVMIARNKLKYLFLVLVSVLIIISSLPIQGHNISILLWGTFRVRIDHVVHFIIYSGISYIGFLTYGSELKIKKLLLILFGLSFFALLEEGHQKWIPMRDASWGDYFFDVLGVVAGFILFLFTYRFHKLRKITSQSPYNND